MSSLFLCQLLVLCLANSHGMCVKAPDQLTDEMRTSPRRKARAAGGKGRTSRCEVSGWFCGFWELFKESAGLRHSDVACGAMSRTLSTLYLDLSVSATDGLLFRTVFSPADCITHNAFKVKMSPSLWNNLGSRS